ncbi:hypothetical protein [Carnobacterium pleistocenium]|uniref:hypothetical protein n=1 Tax=Carnobacterium pleistocenium TaxID=181073 RepID=UPI00054ECBEF|nr:hypothetical protein [Carnobacterium pleistocenium]
MKHLKTTKISFLVVQICMIGYFIIRPTDYNKLTGAVWLLMSCIGLFIVAFSMSNIPMDKKSRLVIFGIFILAIVSIVLVISFVIITAITSSM